MKKVPFGMFAIFTVAVSLLAGCASLRTEQVSYVRENNWSFLNNEDRTEARKQYDSAIDPASRCFDPAWQNYDSLKFCGVELETNLHRARIHGFSVRIVADRLYGIYMATTKVSDPRGSYGANFPALKALEVAERYDLGRDKEVAAASVAIEYHLSKASHGGIDAKRALLLARENDFPIDRACAAVREDHGWHRMLGTLDGEEWSLEILDWCGIPVSNHPTLRLRSESASYLRGYEKLKALSGSQLSRYVQAETDYCRAQIKFYCGMESGLSQCGGDELARATATTLCVRPMLLEVATAPDETSRREAVQTARNVLEREKQWWSRRASEGDKRAADFVSEISGQLEALTKEM